MTKETRALIEAAEGLLADVEPIGSREFRLFQALLAAISSAKAAEEGVEGKWISESQEKPAHHSMVLVWREGKEGSPSYVGMAFWAREEGYGWTKGDGNFANDIWATITHWQELPEPPVREKEGLPQ